MNSIQNFARGCSSRLASVSFSPVAGTTRAPPLPFSQPLDQQARFASKYISKSAKKRLPLTTKRAGKGYYKGKGGTKEGRLTSKGRFLADPKKKLELVVPDLEGFSLKPYIARTASKVAPELRRRPGQV